MVSDGIVVYTFLWIITYLGFYLDSENKRLGAWTLAGLSLRIWFWAGVLPDVIIFFMTFIGFLILWKQEVQNDLNDSMWN